MIEWKYPENGDYPPTEEGAEIIAEFEFLATGGLCEAYHMRMWSGLWHIKRFGILADKDINIIAWTPYNAPEPPEKPQDCPFCGSPAHYNEAAEDHHYYRCKRANEVGCPICIVGPDGKTKEEAKKAWNQIRVEGN